MVVVIELHYINFHSFEGETLILDGHETFSLKSQNLEFDSNVMIRVTKLMKSLKTNIIHHHLFKLLCKVCRLNV